MLAGAEHTEFIRRQDVIGCCANDGAAEPSALVLRARPDRLDIPGAQRGTADVDLALDDTGVADDHPVHLGHEVAAAHRVLPVVLGEAILALRERLPEKRAHLPEVNGRQLRRRSGADPDAGRHARTMPQHGRGTQWTRGGPPPPGRRRRAGRFDVRPAGGREECVRRSAR